MSEPTLPTISELPEPADENVAPEPVGEIVSNKSDKSDSGETREKVDIKRSMFTVKQACESILEYYGHGFKNLQFIPPAQIIDGAAAEFFDEHLRVAVATCRIRITNLLLIDPDGRFHLEVLLSDLAFQRGALNMQADK